MATLLVIEIKELHLKTKLSAAEIIEEGLRRYTAEKWTVLFGKAKVDGRLPVELPSAVVDFMQVWNSGNWPLTNNFTFHLHLPEGYLRTTSYPPGLPQNTSQVPTKVPPGVTNVFTGEGTKSPKKPIEWELQDNYVHK